MIKKLHVLLYLFGFCIYFSNINAFEVQVIQKKLTYEVSANLKTKTDICSAWELITDYNNLTTFLPNLYSSEIIKDLGNKKIVRQVFKETLLFFPIKVQADFLVQEDKKNRYIKVVQIKGDMRNYSALWDLRFKSGITSISLTAKITPTPLQSLVVSKAELKNKFINLVGSLNRKLINFNSASDCE